MTMDSQTTGPDVAIVETEDAVERRAREAYFTASQRQLIWARFRKNRSAMIAGIILAIIVLMGVFAPFLSPHDPTIAGRDKDYTNGAPQIPRFCDDNGCSLRPFIYGVKRERSIATNFRWVTTIDTDQRRYVQFFTSGWTYNVGPIKLDTHLFGVDEGFIHLFGTDDTGKDIFSRTLHAIYTSLAVGTLGVLISFGLSLIIGGVAGYFGGVIDGVIQMVTDAIRTGPVIPLFMAIAAFIPQEWSSEMRFFFISIIIGFINWPTLARRVPPHLLVERTQEYVLAVVHLHVGHPVAEDDFYSPSLLQPLEQHPGEIRLVDLEPERVSCVRCQGALVELGDQPLLPISELHRPHYHGLGDQRLGQAQIVQHAPHVPRRQFRPDQVILEYLDPGEAGRGSGAQFLFERAAQRDGGDGVGHGGSP